MTIAACYHSPEGIVFGADSTSTYLIPQGMPRHYDHAQKIFEMGAGRSTLGVVTWGLGGLGELSYRTLISQFAEQNYRQPTQTVGAVADRFAQTFWGEYTVRLAPQIQRLQHLLASPTLTKEEEQERDTLQTTLVGGFCVGGNLFHDKTPSAVEITYGPLLTGPAIRPLPYGLSFWGVPNLILRMFLGIDPALFAAILQSGRWVGTPVDLSNLVDPLRLAAPVALPIRDAIDWVHATVYATIKAMKFSQLAPVCGGPVELAVITTDRPFRWVRHKKLEAAIIHGGASDVYSRTS